MFALRSGKKVSLYYKKSLHRTSQAVFSTGRRPPLPPAPRIPPRNYTETQKIGTLARWWKNGSILITLGWTALALLLLDRYLQYADRQEASELVGVVKEETSQTRARLLQDHANDPSLYKARVIQVYRMGGSHGLNHNVQNGDVLEILQENVGPSNYYHLCRMQDNDKNLVIGWYPKTFLARL